MSPELNMLSFVQDILLVFCSNQIKSDIDADKIVDIIGYYFRFEQRQIVFALMQTKDGVTLPPVTMVATFDEITNFLKSITDENIVNMWKSVIGS